jgi:hypothetical protein
MNYWHGAKKKVPYLDRYDDCLGKWEKVVKGEITFELDGNCESICFPAKAVTKHWGKVVRDFHEMKLTKCKVGTVAQGNEWRVLECHYKIKSIAHEGGLPSTIRLELLAIRGLST